MKKVLICIMVIAVMATSLVLFAGCQSGGAAEPEVMTVSDGAGNKMDSGTVYSMPSQLIFSSVNMSAPAMASPGGLTAKASVRLEATVLPETANNKLVDWFVVWENPESAFASGKDVKEYVNVIPDSDGSNLATVEAYQYFAEELINIIVTTREGSFTAICECSFVGNPNSLEIDLSSFETYLIDSFLGNITTYNFTATETYTLPINIVNGFGHVGDSFSDYTVSVSGAGAIVVDEWHYAATGTSWVNEEDQILVNNLAANFVNATIDNGNVVINVLKRIEDYYSSSLPISASAMAYYDKFKDYVVMQQGPAEPYIVVTVTENVSGVSSSILIHIVGNVEGVQMSSTSIVF